MEKLFRSLDLGELLDRLKFVNSYLNIAEIITAIIAGLFLGFIIALIYWLTTRRILFSVEYAMTLIITVCVITLVVAVTGTNLARAFSLAGAMSIIRFRSLVQTPRNIAYIFLAMGAGFACVAGLFIPALLFVLIVGGTLLIIGLVKSMSKKEVRLIRIDIPENMSFDGVFDEVLDKYSYEYALGEVRLIDGGSVYELSYTARIKDTKQIRELLDELRLRNGNFKVSCMSPLTQQGLES